MNVRLTAACALLAVVSAETAWTQPGDTWTNVNAFVTPADFSAGCAGFSWIDDGTCESLTGGSVSGEAFLWIVASGSDGFDPGSPASPDGISGLELGIAHDLDPTSWTLCTGGLSIPTDTWPASGSGISLTWDGGCYEPPGNNARVGFFYLDDGSSGTLAITPHPVTGTISMTDCNNLTFGICETNAGSIDLAVGNAPLCANGEGGEAPVDLAGISTGCHVDLSWSHSGSGIDGLEVYRDDELVASLPASATSYTDEVPSGGPVYTYRVAAFTECSSASTEPIDVDTQLGVEAASNVAGDAAPCRVTLTWTHSGIDVTGFQILRDGTPVGTVDATSREFTDGDVSASPQSYSYVIRTLRTCDAVDAAPLDVQGVGVPLPTDCAASLDLCGYVRITWSDNSESETGFQILRNGIYLDDAPANATQYDDTSAAPGVDYVYSVRTAASCGLSPPSNTANGRALDVPAASDCVASDDLCDRIDVTWTDNGSDELGFRVLRDGAEIAFVGANVTQFEDWTTKAGSSYPYEIVAVYDCGDAARSNHDDGLQTTPSCRPDAKNFNLFLTEADFSAGCGGYQWIDALGCQSLESAPIQGSAFLWIVVSDGGGFAGEGLTGAQFGIEHDLSAQTWVLCTSGQEIPSPTWPASGSGNAVTWGAECYRPPGNNARIGYLLVEAGDTGTAAITPDPRIDQLLVTDCDNALEQICPGAAGSVDLAIGTVPECDVHTVTPDPPADLTGAPEGCDIRLTWTHDGADVAGFEVSRGSTALATLPADAREYLDAAVPPAGGFFSYTVTALSTCGPPASSGTGVTLDVPASASSCTATQDLCDRIEIAWQDESGSELGFEVYRFDEVIATLPPDATTYTDDTASPGLAYVYTVVALGPCGPVGPSNEATGRVLTAPAAATELIASSGRCNVVELTWSDGGTVHDQQHVYRDGELLVSLPAGANAYDDTTTEPDVVHAYSVVLENDCGATASDEVSGSSTDDPPAPPTDLVASDDLCGRVRLAWADNGVDEDGFRVWRDDVQIDEVGPDVTEYDDPSGVPGVTYTYHVTTFGECGESGPSNADAGTSLEGADPVGVVELVEPEPGVECLFNPITFVWRSDPAAELYQIRIAVQCEQPPPIVITTTPDTTFTASIPPGLHYWRVRGQNACGDWGPWSPCRAVTAEPLLEAPDYLDVQPQEPYWWFSWDDVDGAEYYELAVTPPVGGCPEYGPMTVIYEVSGTDTLIAQSEITEDFYAWVTAVACNRRGEPSNCAGPPVSTPVVLEYFRARPADGAVVTEWRTGSEAGIHGFHVDRETPASGERVRVTPAPIAAGEQVYEHVDRHVALGASYTYILLEVDERGREWELARADVHAAPPLSAGLALRARPNPFNPTVTLELAVPSPGHVRLDLLDASGRVVRRLVDEPMAASLRRVTWNGIDGAGRRVASGVYFARLSTGGEIVIERLVLLK